MSDLANQRRDAMARVAAINDAMGAENVLRWLKQNSGPYIREESDTGTITVKLKFAAATAYADLALNQLNETAQRMLPAVFEQAMADAQAKLDAVK